MTEMELNKIKHVRGLVYYHCGMYWMWTIKAEAAKSERKKAEFYAKARESRSSFYAHLNDYHMLLPQAKPRCCEICEQLGLKSTDEIDRHHPRENYGNPFFTVDLCHTHHKQEYYRHFSLIGDGYLVQLGCIGEWVKASHTKSRLCWEPDPIKSASQKAAIARNRQAEYDKLVSLGMID